MMEQRRANNYPRPSAETYIAHTPLLHTARTARLPAFQPYIGNGDNSINRGTNGLQHNDPHQRYLQYLRNDTEDEEHDGGRRRPIAPRVDIQHRDINQNYNNGYRPMPGLQSQSGPRFYVEQANHPTTSMVDCRQENGGSAILPNPSIPHFGMVMNGTSTSAAITTGSSSTLCRQCNPEVPPNIHVIPTASVPIVRIEQPYSHSVSTAILPNSGRYSHSLPYLVPSFQIPSVQPLNSRPDPTYEPRADNWYHTQDRYRFERSAMTVPAISNSPDIRNYPHHRFLFFETHQEHRCPRCPFTIHTSRQHAIPNVRYVHYHRHVPYYASENHPIYRVVGRGSYQHLHSYAPSSYNYSRINHAIPYHLQPSIHQMLNPAFVDVYDDDPLTVQRHRRISEDTDLTIEGTLHEYHNYREDAYDDDRRISGRSYSE